MKDKAIVIRYDGEMNSELCRGLILAIHNHLAGRETDLLTRKRITHIITECMLNLSHHAEVHADNPRIGKYVELVVEESYDRYLIQTRNYVSNKKVRFLSTRLERINDMNASELYEHYMNQLQTGQFTNKGTAGLGLIDIARKSGNKLNYEFSTITDNMSRFEFSIAINKPKSK